MLQPISHFKRKERYVCEAQRHREEVEAWCERIWSFGRLIDSYEVYHPGSRMWSHSLSHSRKAHRRMSPRSRLTWRWSSQWQILLPPPPLCAWYCVLCSLGTAKRQAIFSDLLWIASSFYIRMTGLWWLYKPSNTGLCLLRLKQCHAEEPRVQR